MSFVIPHIEFTWKYEVWSVKGKVYMYMYEVWSMTYDALLPELSHNIDMSHSCNNAHFSGKKAKVHVPVIFMSESQNICVHVLHWACYKLHATEREKKEELRTHK